MNGDPTLPTTDDATSEPELTVVMPCLNESETLATCIDKAIAAFRAHGIAGEVVIADNGSTDGSQEIAVAHGARVAQIPSRGYGNALMGGIVAARGQYIVMGDSDDSYDFGDIPKFVDKLREGYDLVMGNRFKGGIKPGAMPPLHRYFGNPVLTGIGRLFFRCPSGDFHCGLRGFSKEAAERLDLRTTGMEFASEMVIKATLHKLRVAEVPTTLSPDGRSRPPHLRSWHDGWRHLRFMLLYSPRWLFLYPGFLLVGLGVLLLIAGFFTADAADVRAPLLAAMFGLLGFQSLIFAVFSKVFALTTRLFPPDPRVDRLFKVVTLETGLTVGAVLLVLGIGGIAYSASPWAWGASSGVELAVRPMIASVFALVLGFQIVTSSFFLSLLGLGRR